MSGVSGSPFLQTIFEIIVQFPLSHVILVLLRLARQRELVEGLRGHDLVRRIWSSTIIFEDAPSLRSLTGSSGHLPTLLIWIAVHLWPTHMVYLRAETIALTWVWTCPAPANSWLFQEAVIARHTVLRLILCGRIVIDALILHLCTPFLFLFNAPLLHDLVIGQFILKKLQFYICIVIY